MKRQTAAAILLTSLPALAGAAVLPDSATAGTTTHVKRLLLRETAFHQLGHHHFVGTDRARSRATGKVVGFDSFSGHLDPQSDVARIHAAFAFKGGLILVRARLHGNEGHPTFTGRVTGGTGAFHGARGSVSGRDLGHGRSSFTIRYTL